MTINTAIKYLKPGEAIKRPCMRGYIYAKDITPAAEPDEDGDIKESPEKATAIVLVDRDGNETDFREGGKGECILDEMLFKSLCSDDWEKATRDEFEKARVGAALW